MAMVSAELSASEEEEIRVSMVRSYGNSAHAVERRYGLFMHIAVLMFALMTVANPAWAEAAKPIKLVVLGDSLSAGLGLPAQQAFPTRLQKALQDKGIEVDMTNAGVSGDTSSGGRDRLDWSVSDGTDGVIIELGANDALRGIDPDLTRAALTEIVQRLKVRKIAVMLCGMLAPPNYGADYAARFNSIYPDLAKKFGVPLYPFFLDGVAADAKLNQADGIHPTAPGVDIIVRNILPTVEAFLGTIAEQRR
ncbi:arylesterase [Bradyrhizobium sp. MOS002]|nr:arylesterase [Bradyrhizobium sp. MOS002]